MTWSLNMKFGRTNSFRNSMAKSVKEHGMVVYIYIAKY